MAGTEPRAAGNSLHVPVMWETCVGLLRPAVDSALAAGREPLIVDCTLGMGGHTEAFLTAFPEAHVLGIDRDTQALELAGERLAPFGDRFESVHATYDDIDLALAGRLADGIMMDLGVSSLHLDDESRGFSYAQDAPLDMRMDATSGITAEELLATASAAEIARILRTYGDERFASRIADRIVAEREREPLTRTGQLVDIIDRSIPAPARRTGGHPAKRTFQALRIAVNGELDILERAMPRAIAALPVGGRIVVESYQSLEDRIVKAAFAEGAKSTSPIGLPVELVDHEPYLELLTRGALQADPAEQATNPRSASVRLRAAERIRLTPAHRTHPNVRESHS